MSSQGQPLRGPAGALLVIDQSVLADVVKLTDPDLVTSKDLRRLLRSMGCVGVGSEGLICPSSGAGV